jgi:hypothetical protein
MDPSRLAALGLDRDDLRRAAVESLGRTAGFQVAPAEPPRKARRCRATVSLLDARRRAVAGAGDQVEVLLGLEVEPAEGGGGGREVTRQAEAIRPGEDHRAALLRAVGAAAGRGAATLAVGLALAEKPDDELLRSAESADPRLRDLAVQVLAERRNPAAVPALVGRLRDPDPSVVERAVGALAQIGDPRAVGPLIELARRREGPFVAQLVRIIGDIGGAEAEAYLGTLSEGHPDPAVQASAREALSDLRRRARPAPGSAGPR